MTCCTILLWYFYIKRHEAFLFKAFKYLMLCVYQSKKYIYLLRSIWSPSTTYGPTSHMSLTVSKSDEFTPTVCCRHSNLSQGSLQGEPRSLQMKGPDRTGPSAVTPQTEPGLVLLGYWKRPCVLAGDESPPAQTCCRQQIVSR